MRNEYFFRVAGLLFSVTLPGSWEVETLLPSFRPFRCGSWAKGMRIFRLIVTTQPFVDDGKRTELLGESSNDMGHVRLSRDIDNYRVEIDNGAVENGMVHVMVADSMFDYAMAYLRPEDPSVGTVLSSMIRILYAQAVLEYDGVSVHASCVSQDGRSFLFLGKSGTGKSTHARQWLETFPDCHLLNDDNPVLRIEGGRVMAYGTPWSGKTPCYKNECYPSATSRNEPVHSARGAGSFCRPAAFLLSHPTGCALAGGVVLHIDTDVRTGFRRTDGVLAESRGGKGMRLFN